jgi:hypothetical protein
MAILVDRSFDEIGAKFKYPYRVIIDKSSLESLRFPKVYLTLKIKDDCSDDVARK